jgi:predicted KAP-like P-loop ATPase
MAETETKPGVESKNLQVLTVDNPLTDPKTDRLGYAPFARHLADSICEMAFPGGFVIAVYGSRGFGKTTLLNYIVHYLKQKPENEQPIIVPFNPWLFSGHEDITRRFFDQIQSVLKQGQLVSKGLKQRLADFSKVISEIPLPYAQAGNAVAKVFDDKQKEASDLKQEVEDILLQEHPRIVVTIDDVDNLDAEEIKKLFHIIKAFPNFNDVVYVLVFDKEIVIKALAGTQGISGEAYLNKIIQVPFEIPFPDKILLRRLLFEKLNAVLADTPKQVFERTHWGNVYFQGIDHFINDPRDIVRLTNTLSVTYPAVKGEVNLVDFIAIESLRVFCPVMYDIIRKNPQAFAGQAEHKGYLSFTVDELKRLHDSWMAQLQDKDKEPVKRLLLHLFPKLEAVWANNNYYAAQQEPTWRKQLRVCSLEVFPIYFRLVLPESGLSTTEMKAILANAFDAKALGENLVELANQKRADGTTQVRTFLERLEDYTENEIPLDCIPSIVQALFDVGDQLLRPEDEPWGMFDFGNDVRIGRIIWQLLRRLKEPARFEVFKQVILNGTALSTIVREIANLDQQQGKYGAEQLSPEEEWLISAQHLKELEELAASRVQDVAEQNSLLQTPGLPKLLYCWLKWTSEEEVGQWVKKVINDDEGLVDFLEKFLETTITESESDMVPRKAYRLDPKWLEPYLESSSVIDRVRSLADKSGLTEARTSAIRQFIEEYDLRQQGKDPDKLSTWEVE